MLKALELNGFKSFADKTRFEFPPGITVVVGPNGSGKSNIVDAIKWVLGEQSAKSMRGKDMTDVIFKGSSGANARRPANAATVTLFIDNVQRRFDYDADEISVGRRVYRSGESEYLINGQSARLKDIRELFRGTGIGTDAYSLIEQGKVERMLSTNPKDRRAIFEEAAGISRFKAKKIDAQRRLARVEGNLIRLADIVEEVGSRYRSVKSQATKAARYKETADRLQQLRTYVGLKDWRTFTEKLTELQTEQAEAAAIEQALQEAIAELEQNAQTIDTRLEDFTTRLNQQQETVAQVREKIAQTESALSLNQQRLADLEARSGPQEEEWTRSQQRTVELQSRIDRADAEFQKAQHDHQEAVDALTRLESELQTLDARITSLQTNHQEHRTQHTRLLDLITQLGRNVSTYDAQHQNLSDSKIRLAASLEERDTQIARYQQARATSLEEMQRLQREAESNDNVLADLRQQHEALKSERAARQERWNDLTNQHAGLTHRAEVIEELERSLEGINAGAKEILQAAQQDQTGAFQEVIGLVADLISVNVQHAAIVDVALGELAQYVVVDGVRLINEIADENLKLNGRVGLIQLKHPPTLGADPDVNLNGEPGVIGRADRLAQVAPEFAPFIRQLLGGTWVIKTLGQALHLHLTRQDADRVRLVTLDGEIVEADGSVVAGPKSMTSGLVSRRSELRALQREIKRLDVAIEECRSQIADLEEKETATEQQVQRQLNENKELAAQLADQSMQAKSAAEQISQLTEERNATAEELESVTTQLAQLASTLDAERSQLVAQELAAVNLLQSITEHETGLRDTQTRRTEIEQEATAAKVKLAKAEQQLEGVEARSAQMHQEFEDHRLNVQRLETQREADQQAAQNATQEIESAAAQLEQLKKERDEQTDQLATLNQERLKWDTERREVALALTEKRDQMRLTQDRIHQAEIQLEQIGLQRQQLAERMQDDYGIDITTAQAEPTEQELAQRDQIDAEITELRKEIASIGSVNLDALAELEELETRYLEMDQQYQDLVQAKETLEKIITRIDADSRKLFVETLEAIRQNFRKLFRQTFGGGQADIVLEEGVDPLEAGVEILATPPGKSEFNNSLLSGGEKALTAVSLLMAIFQFRPSPFCVLDEVDAPFDEANIGRFIDVLKSFLGWTKFVIVTHSKKTMTAASTLYGITMQESGVSKRVSVRFEDVSEDGHISEEALHRTDRSDSDAEHAEHVEEESDAEDAA